jgi:hypothetical protein
VLTSSETGLLGHGRGCGFGVTSVAAGACLSSVPLLLLGTGPRCVLLVAFKHELPLVLSAVLMDKLSRVGRTSSGLYVPGGLVPDKMNYM